MSNRGHGDKHHIGIIVLAVCTLITEIRGTPLGDARTSAPAALSFGGLRRDKSWSLLGGLGLPKTRVQASATTNGTQESASPPVKRVGLYINYKYGYETRIPFGYSGCSPSPPSPQHGFSIEFSKQPQRVIWVDGSFNMDSVRTLADVAEYSLRLDADRGRHPVILSKSRARLGGLPALRVTVTYQDKATAERMLDDEVIAIRQQTSNQEDGIVYTVGLITPQRFHARDASLLLRLVQSFRVRRVPR